MLKQMYVLLIVLLAILLASCATTYKLGKHYATENVSQIVIGETTEKDVVALFGSPWKTGLLNGHIVYTYCYAEIVFYHDDSVEKNGNTLVIEFDENQRVLNYYYNIPGKDIPVLSLMMHKEKILKEQQEQIAWQNQVSARAGD